LLWLTRQSIYNWIGAYTQARLLDVLLDEKRPGCPNLWTEDLRALWQSLLKQAPDARLLRGEWERSPLAGGEGALHGPIANVRQCPRHSPLCDRPQPVEDSSAVHQGNGDPVLAR
jgi:hypothetical protein